MNQEKITSLFCLLSGLSESDTEKYSPLIARATSNTLEQMKDKSLAEQYSDALCYVAACLAFYNYVCVLAADSEGEFKAGEVSLKPETKSRVENARCLVDDAICSCSALFKDKSFVFSVIEEDKI